MRQIITTTVCDMAHTSETKAEMTVQIRVPGSQAREVDLCQPCAKKYIEKPFALGRKVKLR